MDDRVTGRLRYSQDAERPGMLVGRILRSLHPHARVTAVRQVDALPPGAVALLPADVADCAPYGCIVPDTHVLAQGRVRFVGDPVAAVAAPDERTASRALQCLEVDYEPLPAVTTLGSALAADAARVHDIEALRSRTGTWPGLRPVGGNVVHRFGLVSRSRRGRIRRGRGRRRGQPGRAPAPPMHRSSRTLPWPSGRQDA